MNRENWEVKELAEIAEIEYGTRIVRKNEEGTKYPVYGGGGITFYADSYNREDKMVIARFGISPKCTRYIVGKFFLNDSGLTVNTISDKINQKFIDTFLFCSNDKIYRLSRGAAQKNLNVDEFKKLIIPVPPLPIQEKIVKELDTLHDILAKKKEQLKELDKLAQATFYEMFGDPMENEKGWAKGVIKDTVSSVNYGTSSPATQDGKFKYLRMNNITYSGFLDLKDMKYIDIEDKNIDKFIVKKGDLLFNRTNSKDLVGKTAVFTEDENMIIAGYIIRIRVNNKFNPFYIWGYLNSSYGKAYLRNLCKNIIGMANINAKELQTIPILFPPLSLQNKFAAKIEAIEKQKELINLSIKEVEQLIGYTVDKYFN